MPNTFTIKTTAEWDSTSMNSEIIPRGDLCIESFDDGDMKLKIGDGLRVFKQLPYICHCHDEDYYTKEEIDVMIDDIKTNLDNYYTKTEIDELLSSLKSELTQYVDDHTHTHDNKDILDQITAPFTIEEKEKIKDIIDVSGYDERISNLESVSHTHDNKDILDSITADNVDSWHTHSNQSILDNTTASFTVNYKNILDNMTTYKIFEPASAYESGSVGLVPAPNRGDHTKFLRGDGKWVYVEGGGDSLEPATRTTLGGVKIGDNINVTEDGTISVENIEPYELPTASSSILGGVKIGNNIDINNGVISVTFPDIPEPYILPKATSSSLGGVIIGNNINVDDGVISVTFPTDAQTVNGHTVESDVPADAKFTDTIYVLPIASADVLGGVKIGDGLSIDNTGVLSANIQENGVLDVSVNTEDPYKLDITFSDHTKSIKLPDPLDVGVIDVRAQQDETVAVLEVEKTSGVSEIDLIALLQGLTINVNFSDDGSVINRAIINKHATERANLTEIVTSDDVINNEHASERANLALTATDVITNTHAVIPDES